MKFDYDVIVVGAGHAGCEAAAAAAGLGSRTLLITRDMNNMAQMSCNPAVGGIAKGQIVREIDALGGWMGRVTDCTTIQFRMLNRSKGPAMWSPRAQCDRAQFVRVWRETIEGIPNLYLWQDTVNQLLLDGQEVRGVRTQLGVEFHARCVVLTNGTFLNGLMHVGSVRFSGGRMAEPAVTGLTEQLVSLGFTANRMKTGTPVRIDGRSVHFEELTEQAGDVDPHRFSYLDNVRSELKQLSCWTLYTNPACHEVLRSGLSESPLYNGSIKSIGPRYCPSIETKIMLFADKTQHQLFLEPEGEQTNEYYLNGFSSSLPFDVQLRALQQLPAFRDIHLYRPGYAIEYDFFDPTELLHTLETKRISRLFFAGQINGTTGYEEAAGQGLVAGINAHLRCHSEDETFVLRRDEAYIGVLIDDLVTKGVDEPYRMFTSRAEYRILLRQDNADMRLTERAYRLGLADDYRYRLFLSKKQACEEVTNFIRSFSVTPERVNDLLLRLGTSPLEHAYKLADVLSRPQVKFTDAMNGIFEFREIIDAISANYRNEVLEAVEIDVKYGGYIKRERLVADKISRLENIRIKGRFDYASIQSLTIEARQKLARINPETLAQAGRIPGVSPNDINVLLVLLGR
ncbi:tRNA uridine 5-carboxymethylaminomethyl modification protein [Tannerella sp. oral taxon BU063 isolate Cell 5]|uniref:tRNA uridine 5-carboxymethylaminomethyl modification enzyme MnmG n=1 Tax=Tannerella sp. oral taxon BU063 isolate Cell 5 TaxID=1410950 RepID=W2CAV9_9BACT|nr:tRNA uridine 5-carboxymethylaminomethyl modification protein [Tannerella sp. oral taxon BU063 isolate Cell 5]